MNNIRKGFLIFYIILLFIFLNTVNAFESVTDTLSEGETKTYTLEGKNYTVDVTAITDTGTIYAKFNINGEPTISLKKGNSTTLSDGVTLTVIDIMPNEAGDVQLDLVEFTLSSPRYLNFSTITSTVQTFLNNSDSFYIVVGSKAPAEDVIAATDIAMGFQYYPMKTCEGKDICKIEINPTKLDSEIDDPYNTNVVSVGRPHHNTITNLFLPSSLWPLEKNTALISRFVHEDTATLVIAGNNDWDTRQASEVIANFDDYNLNDTCFEVDTEDSDDLILSKCNLSKYPINHTIPSEEGPIRAGVLVEFPNGTIYTQCLNVANTTNGYELMQQTDLELLCGPETTWGRMLCKINGVGDNLSGQFCEYSGSFWNYVLDKEGNWLYPPIGLSGGDECWNRDFSWSDWSKVVHYCAKEGDVLGFAYGPVNSSPTYYNFSEICGESSKLRFDNVKAVVDGKSKSIDNGETIKDVNPGSKLEIKGDVENTFTEDEDISIEDISVEVTIKDIDDGDDLEGDDYIGDIDADDKEGFRIMFEIPEDVEEDYYDVIILVEGEDELGEKHIVEWHLTLKLEKDQHDIRIIKSNVLPSKVSCSRKIKVNVGLKNQGKCDEHEVVVKIENPDLNIYYEDTSIPELEEGTGPDTEYEKTYSFKIDDDIKAGTYPISIKAYYDTDTLSDSRTISLIVNDCEEENHPPEIEEVSEVSETIRLGDIVHFEVSASDPNNDDLMFEWYVDGKEAEPYPIEEEEPLEEETTIEELEEEPTEEEEPEPTIEEPASGGGGGGGGGAREESLQIYDIVLSPENEVKAGRALLTTVILKNYGEEEEEAAKIQISIPKLGISASDYVFDIGPKEIVSSEELYMRIPECTEPDDYEVKVELFIDKELVDKDHAEIEVIKGDVVCPEPPAEEPVIIIQQSYFIYYANETGEHEIKVVVSDGEFEKEHIWNISVKDTIESEMKAEVEKLLDSTLFNPINNANMCIIIKEDYDYAHHSFDVVIANGVKQVSISEELYCDGFENEDFVFSFIDYQSFLEQKQDLTLNSLIENCDGSRFYFLPSRFVEKGGNIVMNEEFKEKYCPFVRNNFNGASMILYGLWGCILPPTANTFDGNTTDFSSLNKTELANLSNVVLEKTTYGKIDFGSSILDLTGNLNLDSYVAITNGIVAINTNSLPSLNASATITMYGLTYQTTPIIYYNQGFTTNPSDFTIPCPTDICDNINYNPSTGTLTFDVAHFSSYGTGSNITNHPPIANAGNDQTTSVNTAVTLDGSASYDPDNDTITYSWTQISGTSVIINNANSAVATFTPPLTGSYVFKLTVTDNNSLSDDDSVTISVEELPPSPPPVVVTGNLTISDLDVKVGDKTSKDLNNGDKISRKAKPGDNVKFDIEVKNMFSSSSDISIENIEVTVTIDGIDDGDDLEESVDIDDLDAGDDDSAIIEFTIPQLVDEDTYDVVIEVDAEDEKGKDQDVRWELTLEVKKDKHALLIEKADLSPLTIECNRNPSLDIKVVNTGSEDEDEVRIAISNDELGINIEENNIELEEGSDEDSVFEKIYNLKIDDKAEEGTYPISVKAYYDSKASDEKTVDLVVEKCTKTEEVTPLEIEPVEIITTTKPVTTPVEPSVTEISFTETPGFIAILLFIFIILLGLVLFAFGYMIIIFRK